MCKPAFKEIATELAMDLFLEAKEKGFDYQDLADYTGSTPLTMKAYHYGDGTPSLAVFIAVWKRIKPVKTLKKLAKYSNCVVIQLPEVNKPFTTLLKETSQVMKETADVIDTVSEAVKDNKITQTEKEQINKEIDEAIEELLKLKKVVEGV